MMLVFNAVYPAVNRSSSALVGAAAKIDDRIKSQIKIIHATGELDSGGSWQDTNSDGDFDAFVWVKNVGDSRILDLGQSDVFFGQEGDFSRIPYVDDAGGSFPYWDGQLENDSEWGPSATLKVTIHFSTTLSSGTYLVKMAIPNGVSDEHYFSF
jgi:hypothetical protein